eukprot:4598161-Pleurochrysis_carterae.AAC.1
MHSRQALAHEKTPGWPRAATKRRLAQGPRRAWGHLVVVAAHSEEMARAAVETGGHGYARKTGACEPSKQ